MDTKIVWIIIGNKKTRTSVIETIEKFYKDVGIKSFLTDSHFDKFVDKSHNLPFFIITDGFCNHQSRGGGLIPIRYFHPREYAETFLIPIMTPKFFGFYSKWLFLIKLLYRFG